MIMGIGSDDITILQDSLAFVQHNRRHFVILAACRFDTSRDKRDDIVQPLSKTVTEMHSVVGLACMHISRKLLLHVSELNCVPCKKIL